jgi:hypothetical protein
VLALVQEAVSALRYGWVMHAWRRKGIARALVESCGRGRCPASRLGLDYSVL